MKDLETYLRQHKNAVVLVRWDDQVKMFVADLVIDMIYVDNQVEQEAVGRSMSTAVEALVFGFGVI